MLPRPFASGLCIATRLHASSPRVMHYSAGAWADRFVTKGAMSVDVAGPDGPLTVVVTHMQNSGPIASQYTELREWLQERPVRSTLLVGDFNVDPSRTIKELPSCGKIVRTNSATHDSGELDYGWATADLVTSVRSSDPSPADHVPLLYTVSSCRARGTPLTSVETHQQCHSPRPCTQTHLEDGKCLGDPCQ